MNTSVSTTTLLTVFDVLHLFATQGPRIEKVQVMDWLRRAAPGSRDGSKESQDRRLSRLRAAFRTLDIACTTEAYMADVFLVIKNAAASKQKISQLLDSNSRASRRAA